MFYSFLFYLIYSPCNLLYSLCPSPFYTTYTHTFLFCMSHESYKRIAKNNKAILNKYRSAVVCGNMLMLVVCKALSKNALTATTVLTALIECSVLIVITKMGTAMTSKTREHGDIRHEGVDLASRGIVSALLDTISISLVTKILSICTKRAWMCMLLIPFVFYYELFMRQRTRAAIKTRTA